MLRASRTFLITLIAAYVANKTPELEPKQLEGFPDKVDEAFWKGIKEEQLPRVCDEHFYKLTQVKGTLIHCSLGAAN